MCVDRILLTCGVPSGYVHAARECVLLSQALGLGGFQALLLGRGGIDMHLFSAMQVEEHKDSGLVIEAAGTHAWLLLPTLTDLTVDIARRSGRATASVKNVAEPDELQIVSALAKRHGASAYFAKDGNGVTVSVSNAARPRSAEQWDPLLHAAMRDGFPVEESLWRAVHAQSNSALAPDSVVSRRHAGPVILQDDGTIFGRRPQDDDFDMNMLRKVPTTPH
jgi:hypothetical protein